MLKSSTTIKVDQLPKRVMSHPGEILREDFMKPLGLSAHALALALRVPANRILEITKSKRAITADTAMRLARYFDTSPDVWLNMQQAHDLSKAMQQYGMQVEREVLPRLFEPLCETSISKGVSPDGHTNLMRNAAQSKRRVGRLKRRTPNCTN